MKSAFLTAVASANDPVAPREGQVVTATWARGDLQYSYAPIQNTGKVNSNDSCRPLEFVFSLAYQACITRAKQGAEAAIAAPESALVKYFGTGDAQTRDEVVKTFNNIQEECSLEGNGHLKTICPWEECINDKLNHKATYDENGDLELAVCPLFFSLLDFESEYFCYIDRYAANQGQYMLFYAASTPQVNPAYIESGRTKFTPQNYFDFLRANLKACK